MRAALTLAILVASAGLGGCRPKAERITPAPQDLSAWPDLPVAGFIAGRAASKQDVNDGNAVFAAEHQGRVVGQPLALEIPQFALHVDGESGVQTRVIIVQAERAGGKDMVGYRTLSGEEGVATLPEFKLLGRRPGGE
jgi:hypothetical protein